MQFALPDAVRLLDEIKSHPMKHDAVILLNSCDPANPYGTGIDHGITPELHTRISRIPGNYLILSNGLPAAWIENNGARLFYTEYTDTVANGLKLFIAHLRSAYPGRNEIVVEYCNGRRPGETDAADQLRSLGFYRDKVQTMRLDLR
jgi:hypothetical protein